MGKVSICVLIAIVAVVAVVATEAEVDGPFTYKKQQELKKKFDKIRSKNNKKPAKTFSPKEFIHRRHIKIVPKGDPRAREPGTVPASNNARFALESDSTPLVGAAADLAAPFTSAARFAEAESEQAVTALPQCSNKGAATGSFDGQGMLKPTPTTWKLVPAKSYNSESGNPYRVVRDAYGNIAGTDARLVNVASSGAQQKLHAVCAARFNAMAAAGAAAGAGVFKVASGWRAHPYGNNRDRYCAVMKQKYPGKSCAEAGKLMAFKSPHETGLAFDLGSPAPFAPVMARAASMRASKGFKWLVENAHKFGITPYKHEPWHWECVIPREAWKVGCEFSSNFNTRIEEKTAAGQFTTSAGAWN